MATTQAVWGIDIGASSLKAVKLRAGADGRVDMVAHSYIEHEKILSQPDADKDALIREALEKFLSRHDISKDQVVVGVAGQQTLSRFQKLPPVAPKRVPDIVRYEASQQIPFDLDEVIWDYQTFVKEGLPDVEVGIFAMKREQVRTHLLHFEQASIEPLIVQSGPLAVYNACIFEGLVGDEGAVLLDIGADSTNVVLATPWSVWTRTIKIGGNSFTDALVKFFKLNFARAENLKRSAESSKYQRQIFQALRPVFANLVQDLQQSLGYYGTTHRGVTFEKVIGLGNAFKLPGLQKYLEQNLGMTVITPESFNKLDADAVNEPELLKEHMLTYFEAYGLALQGLDKAKMTTNLLPVEIAKQVVWQRKKPTFAAAAACILLAGATVWYRQFADNSALASNSADASFQSVASVEQADQIINAGVSSSLSPRAQAALVLAAGNKLKAEVASLSSQGVKEMEDTKKLIETMKKKSMVMDITRIIHESLPIPQEFKESGSMDAWMNTLASTERNKRKIMMIEMLNMGYEPMLHEMFPDESMRNLSRTNDVLNDPLTAKAGFYIDLRVTTPFEGGEEYLEKEFLAALRKNGRAEGLGFYFDRVYLEKSEKRSDFLLTHNPGGGAATTSAAGGKGAALSGGGGRDPRGSVGGLSAQALRAFEGPQSPFDATALPEIDPLTGENIKDDWVFTIWIDVVMDEPPAPSESGEVVDDGSTAPVAVPQGSGNREDTVLGD